MIIIGCDEVGRGSLIGPIYAASVIIGENAILGLKDSKLIAKKTREKLALEIMNKCVFHISIATLEEVNDLNVHNASLLAMERACKEIYKKDSIIYVDGKYKLPNLPSNAVISGDKTIAEISAASIIAKVARDNYIATIAREYPEYGWEKNIGYPTKKHLEAIKKFGTTKYHRNWSMFK